MSTIDMKVICPKHQVTLKQTTKVTCPEKKNLCYDKQQKRPVRNNKSCQVDYRKSPRRNNK